MNPYDMPVNTLDQIKAKYEAGGYHGKQYDKGLNRAVEVFFWQRFYLDLLDSRPSTGFRKIEKEWKRE